MRTTASRFPLTPGHWSMALLAVLTPCLVAFHTPPSMTFFNQVMAVIGWGLWLASLGLQPAAWREADTDALAWRGLDRKSTRLNSSH